MTQWQAIETAPKDGTRILVVGLHPGTTLHWMNFAYGDGDGLDGDWMESLHPTHWMPLPDPPQSLHTMEEGSDG
jgi:hypothetical protein